MNQSESILKVLRNCFIATVDANNPNTYTVTDTSGRYIGNYGAESADRALILANEDLRLR